VARRRLVSLRRKALSIAPRNFAELSSLAFDLKDFAFGGAACYDEAQYPNYSAKKPSH
jgi:hypothetical protein